MIHSIDMLQLALTTTGIQMWLALKWITAEITAECEERQGGGAAERSHNLE